MSEERCPRCAYEIPPERRGFGECPRCRVVFARFDPDRGSMQRMQSVNRASEPSRPPLWLFLGAVALLVGAILLLSPKPGGPPIASTSADRPPSEGAEPAEEVTDSPGPPAGLTAEELLSSPDLDAYGDLDPDREKSTLTPAQLADARRAVTEGDYEFSELDPGAGDEPVPSDLPVVTEPGSSPYRWVGWYEGPEGYARAKAQALEMNRPLVIYFHTDWCGYCKRFDADFLPDPLVRRFLSNVLRVHVNPEQSEDAMALAQQYRVAGYPSFFVLPAGTGLEGATRVHPFRNGETLTPQEFTAECEAAAGGV